MKSNIVRILTMCMCLVVLGFASDGKKHLNEIKEIQDKKNAREILMAKTILKEMQINNNAQIEDGKPASTNMPSENTNKVNFTVDGENRSTDLEIYFCTDSYGSESYFNIFNISEGWEYWAGGYGAGWIGNNTCYSEFVNLPDGDYSLVVYDSYGDGGISVGVYDMNVNYVTGVSCANMGGWGYGGECGYTTFTLGGSDVAACADTGCGYWLNYGYSCGQLSGNYGYDCSACEAEGACAACPDGYWDYENL